MDIYEALKKDHDELKPKLAELVALANDGPRRAELLSEIRDALIPHSRSEEAVFYNPLRSVPAAKGLAWHGYEEHVQAETMLRALQVADKLDAGWKSLAQKLKTALEHHIAEEEGEIFAAARGAITTEEATQMAAAFEKMKGSVKEQGFVGTTLDLIANLMPPRFTESFKKRPQKTM